MTPDLIRRSLLISSLGLSALHAHAATLVEFSAINESVLLVHFDDGYAVHHRHGQRRTDNERVIASPLPTKEADLTASYQLRNAAGQPIEISAVHRKSKPTEVALKFDTQGHVLEHWVYLFLPRPLSEGATLTLETSLADNGKRFEFTFDPSKTRSEAIHVNQVGYPAKASRKVGYVSHWAGTGGPIDFSACEGKSFRLVEVETGKTAYSGKLGFSRHKDPVVLLAGKDELRLNDGGTPVWECDFSDFTPTTPAEYRLVVDGVGCSFPFTVGEDALRPAFVSVMRGFYHQRSGIELKAEYTDLPRPAPAHPVLTPGFENRMKYTARRGCDFVHSEDQREATAILAEMKGPLLTYGFYQDAGDWDGYFSHLKVPSMLMMLYELAPSQFADAEFRIPESGNGIPDILDEGAWLLRYLHRTRHAILNTRDSEGKPFGTGGAAGVRVAGDFFGTDEREGKSIPSWEDTHRDYVVSGEDPFASYYYSGLAAQMAWILKGLDREPVHDDWKAQAYDESYDWTKIDWLKEAKETFAWAKQNTRAGDEDKGLRLYRFYAASALYRITGDTLYAESLANDLRFLEKLEGRGSALAYIFLTFPRELQDRLGGSRLREHAIARAYSLTAGSAARRAYRFGGPLGYAVQVGQSSSPMVEETLAAYALTRDPDVRAAIGTTADYVLGGNPLNLCWPTRVGERSPLGIFRMDNWTTSLVHDEKPGLLSGFIREGMPEGITPYGCTAPGRSWIPGDSPYNANWPDKWTYPEVHTWPMHELWYDLWCAPPSAEYTVHETMIASASVFGLLVGDHPKAPAFRPAAIPQR
ncbi:MAG: cellulase N-terminal Ig-like domain-containing protein [Opitutaceae bacterium]|nr:cellulase N-terminal Ig-like domain-containing protein [Opitutaceae bacterium]